MKYLKRSYVMILRKLISICALHLNFQTCLPATKLGGAENLKEQEAIPPLALIVDSIQDRKA